LKINKYCYVDIACTEDARSNTNQINKLHTSPYHCFRMSPPYPVLTFTDLVLSSVYLQPVPPA
jgi:hypothetical protein